MASVETKLRKLHKQATREQERAAKARDKHMDHHVHHHNKTITTGRIATAIAGLLNHDGVD